jgi:acyl-homoserine lactone synthase
MIHTIDRSSAGEGTVLCSMFEARKRVFVDLLKWEVPVLGGTWELDQFDNEEATYIDIAREDGQHLGSARLLPTTRPHILGTLFTGLCDGEVPCGPATFEITRFCLDRSLRAAERREVRNALVTALAEHALVSGIARYTAIAEMGWFQQILAFGWRCMPLGLPRIRTSGMLAALAIDIDEQTPRLLAEAGIWTAGEAAPMISKAA